MEIKVNNEFISVNAGYTIGMLLKDMGYPRAVAVFINTRQLLLKEYDNYELNEKDTVRIIRPLAGG